MNDINIFIEIEAGKEVCVGPALEKEEATHLACKARETRHNKKKTCFVYGLTSLEGIRLFFKPYSLTYEQLKYVSRTYTRGTVYVTYLSR